MMMYKGLCILLWPFMLLAGLGMVWSMIHNIFMVFELKSDAWIINSYFLNFSVLFFAWGPACAVQFIPARKLFPKRFFFPSRDEFYKGVNHFCFKWMIRFEIGFLFYCIVLFSLSYFLLGTFELVKFSTSLMLTLFYGGALKIMSAAYNSAHLPDMDKKRFEEKNASSEKKKTIPKEKYNGGKQRQYDFPNDDYDAVEVDLSVFTTKRKSSK